MMRPALATSIAAAGVLVVGAAVAAPEAPSFEDLAREAVPISDLGMLVAPFADDCRRSAGDLERARCETVRGFLRAGLPAKTFAFTRDADAVLAAPYDARAGAVTLAVVGCLACKRLVEAGSERRYVTLKAPTRGASGGPVAAEVARASVSVASAAAAEAWVKTVQPRLRAEFLFRPTDEPWTIGTSRGYAFAPVAVRVYDRCTGDIVYSQPPSRQAAPREAQCTAPEAGEAAEASTEDLPPSLSSAAINEALGQVRADLDACLRDGQLTGTSRLVFEVAGSGQTRSVDVKGSAAGTPVGQCLASAAARVRFPAFRAERQRFEYPVRLQRR
jgi:hypothetical protein